MNMRRMATCFLVCFIITLLGPLTGAVFAQGGNGQLGVDPAKPMTFSWSPFKETTKYRLVVARDAAMTQPIIDVEVAGTQYVYNGKLDYMTNYFWRVMALEPAPSDWSATFSFQTMAEPVPQSPPPSQTGISCAKANAGSPTTSSDISPFLLGAVILGLVFAGRQRPGR